MAPISVVENESAHRLELEAAVAAGSSVRDYNRVGTGRCATGKGKELVMGMQVDPTVVWFRHSAG